MAYDSAGALDYDDLNEMDVDENLPLDDEDVPGNEENLDDILEIWPGEEDGDRGRITPEPDATIGFSLSDDGRHAVWASPGGSTGDSGIESGASGTDQARSNSSPDISSNESERNESLSPVFEEPSTSAVKFESSDAASTCPATAVIAKRRLCHLAYHHLPGYPRIRPTYPFLHPKRDEIPAKHQLLHLCHDGPEHELLVKLQQIITTFDYVKVVVFARRTERLLDIKVALKKNCSVDSLLIPGEASSEKVEKVCSQFAEMRRPCLICSADVLPSTSALSGVNLVVWWNLPYNLDHLIAITTRLNERALILVVVKQEDDWEFLNDAHERGQVVFPEIDLDSTDPAVAGFINTVAVTTID
ncbi:hypothetical protein BV898_16159 [Hypsibius exemplaris]|uniref:Helicase C-terminal domain-containing protein n=1 Tax=Hypsibius exemplaris TaxID=2072580 RepID=A0A9X6NJN6_HYPEX|nr:hypothetical protein BV898_16159 [Hypsibius exemplaris]